MFTFPSYKLTCTWPSATAPWVVQGCCYRQARGSFSVGAGELLAPWPGALSLYASSLQHPVQWSSIEMGSGKGNYSLPGEAVGHRLDSSKSFM